MRMFSLVLAVCFAFVAAGCGDDQSSDPSLSGANGGAPDSAGNGAGAKPPGDVGGSVAAITDGVAKLNPENTSIGFVGTKADGSHTGGFKEFSGEVRVDEASGRLLGVSVEIQTKSLWSDNEQKLTDHLKSVDFFNVNEHPTITFESTSFDGEGADVTIRGNMTMLETTKEISIPAQVNVENGTLSLTSEFTIDRTEFGMNYRPDQVNPEVAITVTVGGKPADAETGT